LTTALSVTSTPDYLLASSLYAALPIVLTIVHFDGTSILSLHNSKQKSERDATSRMRIKGRWVVP
jgi:hypothetical protein